MVARPNDAAPEGDVLAELVAQLIADYTDELRELETKIARLEQILRSVDPT